MKTEDKGKKYICWRESGRLRLAGESRFIKKGLSTGFFFTETACKVNTDSILSANYWSSTENSNNSNNAWNVNFNNGNVNCLFVKKVDSLSLDVSSLRTLCFIVMNTLFHPYEHFVSS